MKYILIHTHQSSNFVKHHFSYSLIFCNTGSGQTGFGLTGLELFSPRITRTSCHFCTAGLFSYARENFGGTPRRAHMLINCGLGNDRSIIITAAGSRRAPRRNYILMARYCFLPGVFSWHARALYNELLHLSLSLSLCASE